MIKIVYAVIVMFVGVRAPAQAQNVVGQWSGTATTETEDTRIVLDITDTDGVFSASMFLPDIGVSGWPARSVKLSENALEIVFPSDSGPQMMQFNIRDEQLSGTWRESRFSMDANLELTREEGQQGNREQPIEVSGSAGKLGATLVAPDCAAGCPGVVFLHGSGPQPRDSNRFAANVLADNGIASIIFDKRGVGESEGGLEGVTFSDLAADAIAAAEVLKRQSGTISVGFFGHSQGGWVAALAGSMWEETAFVITSAGPAVSPSREAEWDVVWRLRNAGYSTEIEEHARKLVQLWHDGVRTGDWSTFDGAVNEVRSEVWFNLAGFDAFLVRPGESFTTSYRAFMDYDPEPALTSQNSPMYAILAPDDESIDAKETEAILRALQRNGYDIMLKIYTGYDHTMRRLGTDGNRLRWPEHPLDYFTSQINFIHATTN